MIYQSIKKLVTYALEKGLISPLDKVYATNRLLEALELDSYEEPQEEYAEVDLEETLRELLDYACEKGLCENSVVYRDLFDTKLMVLQTPRQSYVNEKFRADYAESP